MNAFEHTKASHCRTSSSSCGEGKSLLAIFPTGGGKSLTFQLPALMAGRSVHGLTVVISLAVTNERPSRQPCRQRHHGCRDHKWNVRPHHKSTVHTKSTRRRSLTFVYISRNASFKTIEKILIARHVVRFVIDEAHCFSSWGRISGLTIST